MFTYEQKKFMENIGITVNFDRMADTDYIEIEDKVSTYLQRKGFDADYKPTKDGLMCESILDNL